jgi:hypothetical protein
MIRFAILVLAGSASIVPSALAEDSPYSDALKLKQQIEKATGGNTASETAAATPSAAPSLHIDAPKRDAGWWEFASFGQSGNPMATQYLCIGDASEKIYSAFDQLTGELMTGSPCAKRDFKQEGEGWAFETSCNPFDLPMMGDMSINAKGTIAGDMARQYEVQQTVTSAGTTTTGVIKATWKGPCPEGRKEGDLVDASGEFLLNVIE